MLAVKRESNKGPKRPRRVSSGGCTTVLYHSMVLYPKEKNRKKRAFVPWAEKDIWTTGRQLDRWTLRFSIYVPVLYYCQLNLVPVYFSILFLVCNHLWPKLHNFSAKAIQSDYKVLKLRRSALRPSLLTVVQFKYYRIVLYQVRFSYKYCLCSEYFQQKVLSD